MDETEALIDRIIAAEPRLKQLDREQVSVYVGLRAGRRDTTPAQLAAEALNWNGGRVTPRQLANATGLTAGQADRAARDGWRSMQLEGVDPHNPPPRAPSPKAPVATPPRELTPPPGQPPTLPRTGREPAQPPLSFSPPPGAPRPLAGERARAIVDRLGGAGIDRVKAADYIAANRSRPGVSDEQLAAEALMMQGRIPLGRDIARVAGLPDQLAGNAALRAARQHLKQSPETQAAMQLASTGSRSPEIDRLIDARAARQQIRDQQAAEAAAARLQEVAQRQAQAPRLPPRPAGAARGTGFMPERYMVPGDTDYLHRIMGSTPYRPSQTYVYASRVNHYVDEMLSGRFNARAVERSGAGPVVIDPMTNLVGGGHHRLIAAVIVSRRTGRPVFARDGANAILPNPAPPREGVREARGAGWALAVRQDPPAGGGG